MLETALYSLAAFGLGWVIFLSYLGFRMLVSAASFAAKLGIASARVGLLERTHPDVRAEVNKQAAARAAKEAEEEEAKGG